MLVTCMLAWKDKSYVRMYVVSWTNCTAGRSSYRDGVSGVGVTITDLVGRLADLFLVARSRVGLNEGL